MIYFRGGSDISRRVIYCRGGIRYFRGGSDILGADQIFWGGIRYFLAGSDVSAGFGYCRRHPINQGGR